MPRGCALSYVIPARNAGMTIRATLDSLLGQSLPDWRAVVVDDASTDKTAEIAGSIRDSRIDLIQIEPSGVARTREIGANALQRDPQPICFLDADDELEPDHARRLSEAIGAAEAVACGASLIDVGGAALGWSDAPSLRDLTPERLLVAPRLLIGAVAIRPEALARVRQQWGGLFDPTLRCEDWDFWLRLVGASVHWADPVAEPLLRYRVAPATRSSALGAMFDDGRIVIERHAPYGALTRQAQRRHAMGVLMRALACGNHDVLERAHESLGTIRPEERELLPAALRWALLMEHPGQMPPLEAIAARARSLPSLGIDVEELIHRAQRRDDDWRAIAIAAIESCGTNQTLVIAGAGRHGRLVHQALRDAGHGDIAWLDDDPASQLPGPRVLDEDLGDHHVVLVTPDAREVFLERLRGTRAGRILLPEELVPSSQLAVA